MKPHRFTGHIWEASEEPSKVFLKTMRQCWVRDIRIAIRSVRSESSSQPSRSAAVHVST
jgi:hypothetical protein